ncbi:hypothetical protein HanPSC8_Chr03g0105821 [Helianthus annuus]|nr:hypothetical protein HanPSC8_Chr03g0105821 [Helianthus annuus]
MLKQCQLIFELLHLKIEERIKCHIHLKVWQVLRLSSKGLFVSC